MWWFDYSLWLGCRRLLVIVVRMRGLEFDNGDGLIESVLRKDNRVSNFCLFSRQP